MSDQSPAEGADNNEVSNLARRRRVEREEAPPDQPAGRQTDPARGRPAGAEPAAAPPGATKPGPETRQTPEEPLPERLRRRYLVDQQGDTANLYLDRDAVAKKVPSIVDRGDTLGTKLGHKDIVRDIIDIAEHRRWSQIAVKGTDEFRREAWLEAASRGMEVRGYKPSDIDRQELQRRLDARPQLSVERVADPEAPAQSRARPRPDEPAPAMPGRAKASLPAGAGELLEHGAAPYRFDPKNDRSYFAKIRAEDGTEHVSWGKHIQRALTDAGAKPGDIITLTRGRSEQVVVDANERNDRGAVVREFMKETIRNEWAVEIHGRGPDRDEPKQAAAAPTQDPLKERAERFRTIDQGDAGKHPDLQDALSRLALVKAALAEAGVPAGEQERVVGIARDRIAADIERGASPAPVRVKDDPSNPALGERLVAAQQDLQAMRTERAIGGDIRKAQDAATQAIDDKRQPAGRAMSDGDDGVKADRAPQKVRR